MTCQDFEELLSAYVLGALTAEERIEVKEHLAQCPPCLKHLQELQAIANLLPLTAPEVEPAVDLKARFFSQLEGKRHGKGQPIAARRRHARPAGHAAHWTRALLVSAAVLWLSLATGLIIWNVSLQQQVADLTKTMVHTTSYQLQGTTAAGSARGELMCSRQQDICTLVIHGLPQPEKKQIYQGWLLRGKQPTSIGILNVQQGVATLTFEGSTAGFDTAAISLEPGPSASRDAPKGQVFAAGTLGISTKT